MKKIFLLAITALVASSSGCEKPAEPETSKDSVEISPETLTVSYEKTEQTITVTSNCDWGVSADNKEWLSVTPSGGGAGTTNVKVSIAENGTLAKRESAITVRFASGEKKVAVSQNYKIEAAEISDPGLLKALLKSYDADNDGVLSKVEASAVTKIEAAGYGIKAVPELTGIFKNVTHLDVSNNDIAELNIQQMSKLEYFDCRGNKNLKNIYVWSAFQPKANFFKPDAAKYVEPDINTPQGYTLVWQDEFNEGTSLDPAKWTHEVKNAGWVNNEKQNYVANKSPKGQKVTELVDGALHINCFKEDGKVYSGRVYGNVKTGWKYGYVEASINLPSGKGTWPAFWMMPVHFTSWPADGEIDIMEEVGYHRDYVSSSLHATGHVHSNNTQVTKEVYCKGAEGEYHTYGMEWTPDYFQFYVDGKKTLYYKNPGTGKVDWPYDAPFYVIFNLAWGGDWGGSQGVDESKLPVTMKVDYVRVFQKL